MPAAPWLVVGFGLAFGLIIGSFLNVVVYRLPRDESIARPGSHCPSCKTPIAPWHNVPVLSFLLLRGRCAHCQAPISWRYPLVELSTGLIFAGLVFVHGWTPMTVLWWVFAAVLIASAGVDFDERWIPDELSLGGLAVGLTLVPAARALEGADLFAAFQQSLIGALLGGGILWLVGFSHARVSAALGRRFEHWPGEGEEPPRPASLDYWVWFPGLGFGDVKLIAMVGAFLGPQVVLPVILLAALLGLVLGLLSLGRSGLDSPFGFGPAIAAAALVGSFAPHAFGLV
jgi:leader peptidase (prepilin peptidase)/N-methyltransferase